MTTLVDFNSIFLTCYFLVCYFHLRWLVPEPNDPSCYMFVVCLNNHGWKRKQNRIYLYRMGCEGFLSRKRRSRTGDRKHANIKRCLRTSGKRHIEIVKLTH